MINPTKGGCQGGWGQENYSVSKALAFFAFLRSKRLSRSLDSYRILNSIIQWLESPYFDVLKTYILWVESWNYKFNFDILQTWRCGGQAMSSIQKLMDDTQMPIAPEQAFKEKSTKLLILLPIRTIYFRTFQFETPCMTNSHVIFEFVTTRNTLASQTNSGRVPSDLHLNVIFLRNFYFSIRKILAVSSFV